MLLYSPWPPEVMWLYTSTIHQYTPCPVYLRLWLENHVKKIQTNSWAQTKYFPISAPWGSSPYTASLFSMTGVWCVGFTGRLCAAISHRPVENVWIEFYRIPSVGHESYCRFRPLISSGAGAMVSNKPKSPESSSKHITSSSCWSSAVIAFLFGPCYIIFQQ